MAVLFAGLIRLGNWRYFLTGFTLIAAAGLILRAVGKILDPFAKWRVFRGTCSESDGSGALSVEFTDGHRLQHSAAFRSEEPQAAQIRAGDNVTIALRTERFISGSYPAKLCDAAQAGGDILLRSEQRRLLHRELLRTVLIQAVICGIAAAVFLLTKQFCFPAG